jgi:hypothetical protein
MHECHLVLLTDVHYSLPNSVQLMNQQSQPVLVACCSQGVWPATIAEEVAAQDGRMSGVLYVMLGNPGLMWAETRVLKFELQRAGGTMQSAEAVQRVCGPKAIGFVNRLV